MKKWLYVISSIILSITSMIALFGGIINENPLFGLILCFLCLTLSDICLKKLPPDPWEKTLNEQKKQKKLHGGYRCPNCGFKSGHEISYGEKRASIRRRGMASNKIGKSYKCANCNYMW